MSEFDTGMGTTPGMWEMVSEALDGEKLPESINKAIYALRDGAATVAMGGGWQPIETAPKVSPGPYESGPRIMVCVAGAKNSCQFASWSWHKNGTSGSWKGAFGVCCATHWMPQPEPP